MEPQQPWKPWEIVGRVVIGVGALGLAIYHVTEVEPDIDGVTLALLATAVVALYAHRITKVGFVELSDSSRREEVISAADTAMAGPFLAQAPESVEELPQTAATTAQGAHTVLVEALAGLARHTGLDADVPVGQLLNALRQEGVLDDQAAAALRRQLAASQTGRRLADTEQNRRATEQLLASAHSAAAYLRGVVPPLA